MYKTFTDSGFVKDRLYKHIDVSFKYDHDRWSSYGTINFKKKPQGVQTIFRMNTRAFDCCGTSSIENMEVAFPDKEAEQEFFTELIRRTQYYLDDMSTNIKDSPNILFVLSDSQVHYYFKEGYLIHKLISELGAKEISSFNNRVHGPHKLHMYSWHPYDCQEELKKIIFHNTENSIIPLYMKEIWENELKECQAADRAKQEKYRATIAGLEQQAQAPINGGFAGAVGNGNLGAVFGAGIQEPQPYQGIQEQANWAVQRDQLVRNNIVK